MIFIAGATGFVGGHLVSHLLDKGHRLKCLVRSSRAADELSARGVTVVRGDITDSGSLAGVLDPDDLVIHLVGIIEEKGGATFESVHVRGTANLIAEAKRAGVRHFFYQSALGADLSSFAAYLRTKAEAEKMVRSSGLTWTIFRPSLIIGPWDGFTRKLMDMLKLAPVLPIPGQGAARFQPVYIKDWLRCMEAVIERPLDYNGLYDIGGPEQLTYRQIVEALASAMGRSMPSVSIPMGLMKFSASVLQAVLPSPPVTVEQLRLLEQDNICAPDAVEKAFGFAPTRYREALKEFIS